jgi:tetratricopeptide (TPR) repeat protein
MRQIPIPGLIPGLLALFLFLVPGVPALAQNAQNGRSEVGEVSFANSGSPAAQEPFLRGFALLHNFEYADAAEQFRKAQEIDPGFAMAFWGEAMTFNHPIWMQQDLDAARAVLARLGATPEARLAKAKTEREQGYLRALEVLYGSGAKEERDFHYADAMAALHQRFPDDVDATAFYALSLLGTAHQGRDFATYMRSAALLEEVFPAHPRHPGVLHYLIHSYDDPIHAPLGIRAARLYGGVAPNAGHALHMTSHIFVALGQWDDVIAANQRAMRVVDEHRAAQGKPRQACGHYASWLHYAFLQERRFDEAKQQLDACREMAMKEIASPKPAKDAHASHTADYAEHARDYAEMRVFHAIETGRWDAADPFILPPGPDHDGPRFTLAYGEALAAAGGDLQALHAAAVRLRERNQQKKGTDPDPLHRQRAEIRVRQIDALEQLREGKKDEGIALLRQAAEAESAMALEFGPPVVEKPAWELLGDELLALGRHAEAEQAYQSALARAPGRTRSLEGLLRAEQALGKTEAAERTRAQLRQYVRTEAAAR